MARIFHDGFETGRPTGTTTSAYNNSMWITHRSDRGRTTVQSSIKKSGSRALRGYRDAAVWQHGRLSRDLGASLAEHYGRTELYVDSVSPTSQVIVFHDSEGSLVGDIRVGLSGGLVSLSLYINDVVVATAADAFSQNTWVRIEWRLKVATVDGVFELKRNGDVVASYTGNTQQGNEPNVRTVSLGRVTNSFTYNIYWDDFAINNTTGTVNNSWVGPGSILLLRPKGPGNYTQWTPDSGNNFARVNEIPETGDSAYIESDTADQIDTYEMQTLADLGVDTSDPSFSIKAVQHLMIGRWEEAETELARVLRLGTTDNTGVAVTLSNTYYRYWDEMFDVNPFDSQPWELADLNSLEAGIKHIAASP